MKCVNFLLLFAIFAVPSCKEAPRSEQTVISKVVYGEDDRLDLFENNVPLYNNLAKSVATNIHKSLVQAELDGSAILKIWDSPTLGRSKNLCSDSLVVRLGPHVPSSRVRVADELRTNFLLSGWLLVHVGGTFGRSAERCATHLRETGTRS